MSLVMCGTGVAICAKLKFHAVVSKLSKDIHSSNWSQTVPYNLDKITTAFGEAVAMILLSR